MALDVRPAAWGDVRFGRDVERVRRHLAPIRDRSLLASSFGREGFWARSMPDDTVRVLVTSPITVAYAIRWLELGDGRARPVFGASDRATRQRPGARGSGVSASAAAPG